MDTSPQVHCPYCPNHQLDRLGHHAMTCKWGGDVVVRHNALRDVVAQFCHRARLGGQLEVSHGSGSDSSHKLASRHLGAQLVEWQASCF